MESYPMKFLLEIELPKGMTGTELSELLDAELHPWLVDDDKPLTVGINGVVSQVSTVP
jgi:hypothetical protein